MPVLIDETPFAVNFNFRPSAAEAARLTVQFNDRGAVFIKKAVLIVYPKIISQTFPEVINIIIAADYFIGNDYFARFIYKPCLINATQRPFLMLPTFLSATLAYFYPSRVSNLVISLLVFLFILFINVIFLSLY